MGKKGSNVSKHRTEGDILFVQCRDCDGPSDISSDGCIRCLSSGIGNNSVRKIVMRSGADTEYTGDPVTILNRLSRVLSTLNVTSDLGRSSKNCILCKCRPSDMMNALREGFPKMDVSEHINTLGQFEPNGDECVRCISSTYDILDQLDYSYKDIERFAVSVSYMTSGV